MEGWQDIANAPLDGTWVLAYNPMIGVYRTKFTGEYWMMNGWDEVPGLWYPEPHYWMPLPAPPQIARPSPRPLAKGPGKVVPFTQQVRG